MTARLETPRRILAMSEAGGPDTVVESALALAEAHDATLEVMACVEPPPDLSILARLTGETTDRLIEQTVERTRAALRARLAEAAAGRAVGLSVVVGKSYLEIIRHAARFRSDFVVKQVEPLAGKGPLPFSSTDQHLLRKCPCPVWLLTPGSTGRPTRILAAVDLDTGDAPEPETLIALNRRIIDAACIMAQAPGAEIILLHAWDAIGEGLVWAFAGGTGARISSDRYVNEVLGARRRAMDRLFARIRAETGPRARIRPRLVRGAAETVIRDQSRLLAADLVVMGTVARTGVSGVLIGNTAENIVNCLDCPVLAVKPEGFRSPLRLP